MKNSDISSTNDLTNNSVVKSNQTKFQRSSLYYSYILRKQSDFTKFEIVFIQMLLETPIKPEKTVKYSRISNGITFEVISKLSLPNTEKLVPDGSGKVRNHLFGETKYFNVVESPKITKLKEKRFIALYKPSEHIIYFIENLQESVKLVEAYIAEIEKSREMCTQNDIVPEYEYDSEYIVSADSLRICRSFIEKFYTSANVFIGPLKSLDELKTSNHWVSII